MLKKEFRHGFAESDWQRAKDEAREIMADCARRQRDISYSDLVSRITAIRLEAYDTKLDHFLAQIAAEENAEGRGMLTVVVVHKTGDQMPGTGFFKMAEELGRETGDREKCWMDELKYVYAQWAP